MNHDTLLAVGAFLAYTSVILAIMYWNKRY